jgi:hypothetical protein
MTKTVSIKIPVEEFARIPKNNVSRFFREAAREKLEREKKVKWNPTTAYGKKLLSLSRKYKGERLSDNEILRELKERSGGLRD